MGIYDRHNRRESRERRNRPARQLQPLGQPDDPSSRQVLVAVGKMALTFLTVFLSLRVPMPLVAKLGLIGILLGLGAFWIVRGYHNKQ